MEISFYPAYFHWAFRSALSNFPRFLDEDFDKKRAMGSQERTDDYRRRNTIPDSEDILPEEQPGQSTLHQKSESWKYINSEVTGQFDSLQTPQKTRYNLGDIDFNVTIIYWTLGCCGVMYSHPKWPPLGGWFHGFLWCLPSAQPHEFLGQPNQPIGSSSCDFLKSLLQSWMCHHTRQLVHGFSHNFGHIWLHKNFIGR